MKSKTRFRSLILVYPIRMQGVAASARGRIIEWLPKIVASQKPLKAAARSPVPGPVSSQRVGFQTGGNHGVGFQRLLIEAGAFSSRASRSHRCQWA